jgi:hypothetical protein
VRGQRFPKCQGCTERVLFELVHAAPDLFRHTTFILYELPVIEEADSAGGVRGSRVYCWTDRACRCRAFASSVTRTASSSGTGRGASIHESASSTALPSYTRYNSRILTDGQFCRTSKAICRLTFRDTAWPITATSKACSSQAATSSSSSVHGMTVCPACSRMSLRVWINTGLMPVHRTSAITLPFQMQVRGTKIVGVSSLTILSCFAHESLSGTRLMWQFDFRHCSAYSVRHVLCLGRELHGLWLRYHLFRHRSANGAHASVRNTSAIFRELYS